MSDLISIAEHGTDELCPECEAPVVMTQSEGGSSCVGCDCGSYLVA